MLRGVCARRGRETGGLRAGDVKVVIMGSGRIGARVASSLATDGHDVSVIEPSRTQVMNLPRTLVDSGAIRLVVGDGSPAEAMLEAGL